MLHQVKGYVRDGWPAYLSSVDTLLKPSFERRGLLILTVNKGLLLLGRRLVIPLNQRVQVLSKIHKRHLGVNK